MSEVYWEHGLWELLDFLDNEALAAAGPWNDVGVFAVLKNLVCFEQEGWDVVGLAVFGEGDWVLGGGFVEFGNAFLLHVGYGQFDFV